MGELLSEEPGCAETLCTTRLGFLTGNVSGDQKVSQEPSARQKGTQAGDGEQAEEGDLLGRAKPEQQPPSPGDGSSSELRPCAQGSSITIHNAPRRKCRCQNLWPRCLGNLLFKVIIKIKPPFPPRGSAGCKKPRPCMSWSSTCVRARGGRAGPTGRAAQKARLMRLLNRRESVIFICIFLYHNFLAA